VAANPAATTLDASTAVVRPPVEVDSANASNTAEPTDAALHLAAELRTFQKLAAEIGSNLAPAAEFDERCNQAFSLANDLFGHAPTWVCFFREVVGVGGLTRRLFPTVEEYSQFMTTSHYDQVQQMLTALRSRDLPENDPNDPQRMITVRLPKSLHEALVDEAGRLSISVNKLCISRLLQVLDQKMVPETVSKPRGRKPRSRVMETEVSSAPVSQQ
jgi:predicted HicB family RNase H-like nuclease